MQLELIFLQDLHGALMRLGNELEDGRVNALRGAGGAGERRVLVEVGVLNGAERHHAKLLGHTEPCDHVARELGRLLDIVRGTGGHLAEDELLSSTAAAIDGELVQNLLLGGEEALIFLHLHGIAEGARRAGHDGDLGDRSRALLSSRYDGVADLVVRDDLLLVIGQNGGLALLAGDDHLDALLEVLLGRTLATEADGAKGALVNDIGQIGTGSTRCGAGDRGQVDAGLGLHILGMKLEDGLTTGQVRQLDGHAAVEATRTQQCGVKRVWTVGGRKDDDALLVVEAVHLGEKLVERLLALVVSRESATVALLADGIDLIDEDDAGGLFLGLLEQVANLGGAAANEHLDELGTRNGEERYTSLAGDGLGEQGLARAGRTHEQGTARQLGTDLLVALRVLEEVHDLLERFLCLLLAGNILEGHTDILGCDDARTGLTEVAAAQAAEAAAGEIHGGVVVSHGLLHATVEPPAEQEEDEHGREHGHHQVGPHTGILLGDGDLELGTGFLDAVRQIDIGGHGGGAIGLVLLALARVHGLRVIGCIADLLDLFILEVIEQLGIRDILDLHAAVLEAREQHIAENEVHREGDEHVEDHVASTLVIVHFHGKTPSVRSVSGSGYPAGRNLNG